MTVTIHNENLRQYFTHQVDEATTHTVCGIPIKHVGHTYTYEGKELNCPYCKKRLYGNK